MVQLSKTLVMAMLIAIAGCSGDSEQDAFELVDAFYQTHQASHPSGALSLNELITFRHFLSVPLFDMLKDVSVAEETRQAHNDNDDAPPLVDGDLFTSNPNGASAYRLLTCQVDADRANCSTEVIFSNAQLPTPSKSIDRVALIRESRGWVINNIIYGSAANSGMHQGDLQTYLQSILGNNAIPSARP